MLTPSSQGFVAELRVRPLGEGTLPVWAGIGSPEWGNFQRTTRRDFEQEWKLTQECRESLQSLLEIFESGWEWELSREQCLQVVEGLESWPEFIVEWPDSGLARRRRARAMATSGSQGAVRLEGEVAIDPIWQTRMAAIEKLVSHGPNHLRRPPWPRSCTTRSHPSGRRLASRCSAPPPSR